MKLTNRTNSALIINNKSTSQLVHDWTTAKKKLEKKIASEKNRKVKTELELYHAFFINHSVDQRKGTIKEKSLVRKSSNIYCGSTEIK